MTVADWKTNHGADNYVGTYRGARIPLSRVPEPHQMCPMDIAQGLGNQCRFTGQIRVHYSVAEHCIHASFIVPEEDALEALLHDAQEAYIADLSTPMKAEIGTGYRDIEHRIVAALDARFDMRGRLITLPPSVLAADRSLLMTERDALMLGYDNWGPGFEDAPRYARFKLLYPDRPDLAREAWLHRFNVLMARRGL